MIRTATANEETSSWTDHVERLGAERPDDRAVAFEVLAQGGTATLDALIAGTSNSHWRVRRGCADLMDHLADDRCTESLLRLTHDPVEAVRRLAIHALSCQGCKACPLTVDIVSVLIQRIETDRSERVRRVAIHQLGCQPPDLRASVFLQRLLERTNDCGSASRAQWSLAQQKRGLSHGAEVANQAGFGYKR